MFSKNIAIIGEGVIGVSSALAIGQKFPHSKVYLFIQVIFKYFLDHNIS